MCPVSDGRPALDAPSVPGHHRADIQGLRAVAVLMVVAFHIGASPIGRTRAGGPFALLDAGFIGVDVFFVVSGFVITAMLLRQLDSSGGIAFRDFYARRARRLMPAMALMSVVVLVASILVLNPFGAQQFAARTALAANTFVANVYLYRHTGYFDATAATNPFLHTWSLSVEEQTYLLLPAGLALTAWLGRRLARRRSGPGRDRGSTGAHVGMTVGVIAVSVTSFVAAVAMSRGWRPFGAEAPERLAFLMTPTRLWEFGAGALLALSWRRVRLGARVAAALGVVGFVALIAAAVLIDPGAPFPSVVTLVPVLATVAIIAAGTHGGPITRALSWRPMGWIGDRSYAWYLWHWPAIVLAAAVWPTVSWVPALAAVVALLPAWASYAWVEQPLRVDVRLVGRRAVAMGCTCLLLVIAMVAVVTAGATRGWGVQEADGWYDLPNGRNVGCHLFNRDNRMDWPGEVCTTRPPGPDSGTVLILGDLQADSAAPAVVTAAHELGFATAQWTRSGCPFVGRAPVHAAACADWQHQARALVDELDPVAVVLVADESAYTTAALAEEELADADGSHPASTEAAVRSWADGLDGTLADLAARGTPVVIVGGAPDLGDGFPRERQSVLDPDPAIPTVTADDASARRAAVWDAQRAVAARHGAEVVDPVPLLCTPVCAPLVDGTWRWYQRDQLTNAGSAVLAPSVRDALRRVTGD